MLLILIKFLFLHIAVSIEHEISNVRYNSLISAQCKARCLYEYRHFHTQQRTFTSFYNDEKAKHLTSSINVGTLPWRSIWERCPRLIACSSCLLPCDLDPPLLLSNEQTCSAICSTLKIFQCEQSCLFIRDLYRQQFNCLIDNSCTEAQRKTPVLYNVTAIERKSRRTVRLKWKSDTKADHEPVFYVIEAQWTLPKSNSNQYELVSKWGFVKEEVSQTKAIIRNIQRDNRWYKFRVSAVTRHGYSPYSITKRPFRLSNTFTEKFEINQNQSKSLSNHLDLPRNLSIKDYQFNSDTINITLFWQSPILPVNGYQISWQSENDPSSFVNNIDLSSTLSSLECTVPFLSLDKSYLFKIRSIMTTEGDHVQMSLPSIIRFNYEQEKFSIKNLEISKPFFINGLIKTNISWNKINDSHLKQYEIYWIENQCYSDVISCCYRRDAVTINNFFQLYDLRYNCTYLVMIKPIGLKVQNSYQFYFNVSSCESTYVYGSIRPPCQNDRKTIDLFSSLPSFDLLVTRNRSGLILFWQTINSHLIENLFYELSINQLPEYQNIVKVKLPSTISNYFLPFSKDQDIRYLNVTLYLIDNATVRQQQSILINDKGHEDRHGQFNTGSSSTCRSKYIGYTFIIICFMLSEFLR